VQRWVDYFAQRGHKVHVISFGYYPDTIKNENVKIYCLNRSQSRTKALSYLFDSAFAVFQIKKLFKKINPDIVHAHYVWDYGVVGALLMVRPFVISAWGSDVYVVPKRSRMYRLIITAALKRADIITTTSEYMKTYLHNMFHIPQETLIRVPWGVDLNIFHQGYDEEVKILKERLAIPQGSPVVISNRHMNPLYNVQTIIDAVYHTVKTHPGTTFIMLRGYGSPEFEDEMKVRAESLGISKNIRFISTLLSPEEMVIYLNMADIFISLPMTDQFASSIMEGMACGVIPVVSTIEVYTQYLKDGENAFFVNPENPEELAEKIIYCIDHPQIKEEFSRINRAIIEKEEDWSKNARKMEELYKKLLQEG
jgi:glycosyltransferase involved in cell wall biosynthesis